MKRLIVISIATLIWMIRALSAQAQVVKKVPLFQAIPSVQISITNTKTTNLLFPNKIISIDRGTRDILVQKANGVDNVLQLKAAAENFDETNVSVITSDGSLYSFILTFSKHPGTFCFQFLQDSGDSKPPVIIMPELVTDASAHNAAAQVLHQPQSLHGVHDKKLGVDLRLEGLFIKEDILYLQLRLQNKSTINYDIDLLHFFIKDGQQAKRTASQEIPLAPLFSIGNTSRVKSDSVEMLVMAIPKFTIPDRKWLCVQLLEKNGGRHLQLKIKNRILMRANRIDEEPLPVMQ